MMKLGKGAEEFWLDEGSDVCRVVEISKNGSMDGQRRQDILSRAARYAHYH